MKKHNKSKPRVYTKNLHFKIPKSIGKQIFMENATKITKDMNLNIDGSLDKITITLQGDRYKVMTIAESLKKLEAEIINAFSSDTNGYYFYGNEFLRIALKPPLQKDFIFKALELSNEPSELSNHGIKSTATFKKLSDIHKLIIQIIRQNNHRIENSGVYKFLILVQFNTGKTEFQAEKWAIDTGILHIVNGNLEFKIPLSDAYNILANEQKDETIKITPPSDKDMLHEIGINEIFEGGKIIFLKNGEELDSSTFESFNKREYRDAGE